MKEIDLEIYFQGVSHFSGLAARATMVRWVKAAVERDTVVTIRFVDEKEGLELNRTYRGKAYATNVLTFDYQQEPTVETDIVICVPVLEREAKEQNKTFKAHLAHLLVHGILHAHGYDHMTDEDAEIMESKETEILTSLRFPAPYTDRNYKICHK